MRNFIVCICILIAYVASAATKTWTGGATTAYWSNPTNWGGTAPVAYDDLVFSGTTKLVNTNDFAGGTIFSNLTFDATAGAFVLKNSGDNWIHIYGNISNASTSVQCIQPNFECDGKTCTVTAAGDIIFSNRITLAYLRFMGPADSYLCDSRADGNDNSTTAAFVLGGKLFLNKTSSSSVHALNGINAITNGAVVKITGTGNDQIYDSYGTVATWGGIRDLRGILDLGGHSEGVNGINYTTNLTGVVTNSTVGTTSVLTLGTGSGTGSCGASLVYGDGAVSLTKTGTGTVTMYATNTYSGGTAVNGGVLAFGADSATLGAANSQKVPCLGGGPITVNSGQLRLGGYGGGLSRIYHTNNLTLNGGSLVVVDSEQHFTNSTVTVGDSPTLYTRWSTKDIYFDSPIQGTGTITCLYLGGGNAGAKVVFRGNGNTFTGRIVVGPNSGSNGVAFTNGWNGTAINNVTVNGSSAFLNITTTNPVFASTGSLRVDSTGAYGKCNLVGTTQQVQYIYFDKFARHAGTYGSTSSSAFYKDNNMFGGTGIINANDEGYGTTVINSGSTVMHNGSLINVPKVFP